ncbi:unnamed protein product [Dicrocoelium dendriticum]|nr:unnamed protein product [Dicrocoelium dendriticum]
MSDDDLDSLVVEHLANLSAILALMHHLEDSLSLGWVLLAKTRSNLPAGNSSRISSAAYNVHEMSTRGATFRVLNNDTLAPSRAIGDETIQMQVLDELLVNGVHIDPPADPIRWFAGVLVPASLRRAQASFRRALHLAVNLANHRAKLESSSRRLRMLVESRSISTPMQLTEAKQDESESPSTALNTM